MIYKWNASLAVARERNARMASAREKERGAEIGRLQLVEEDEQPMMDDDDEV